MTLSWVRGTVWLGSFLGSVRMRCAWRIRIHEFKYCDLARYKIGVFPNTDHYEVMVLLKRAG